jgi:hypothetical protein
MQREPALPAHERLVQTAATDAHVLAPVPPPERVLPCTAAAPSSSSSVGSDAAVPLDLPMNLDVRSDVVLRLAPVVAVPLP